MIRRSRKRDRRTDRTLDEVLALGLSDERLELGGRECVDEPGLGDDEEEDLGACEGRELVGLLDPREVEPG